MTRKEFVEQIVSDLKANPKAVLRGHGMKPNMLQILASREDILGKIAGFAFSTKLAPKGSKALKKSNDFKIAAYKNFIEFNSKAREDVQAFALTLNDDDQLTFSTKNNVITILALPDHEDTGSVAENVALGKSVMLNFDSSVKKEYKVAGGMYYVIMFGDSSIRPAEASKAEAKASTNEKKVKISQTPQKIKAALVKKAKAKMAKVVSRDKALKAKAALASAEVAEVGAYARQLGLGNEATPGQILSTERGFNRRTTAGAKALKDARIDLHQREINTIRMKNRVLVQKLENAQTAKARADIRFAIRKNHARIEGLKRKIGVYSDLSANTIKNKNKILADINAEIDANLAAGQTITASLNAALQKLDLPAQQKQQIAQQVIEEVVNNQADFQEAVQQVVPQVIQQIVPQQVQVVQQAPKFQAPQQLAPVAKRKPGRRKRTIEEILNAPQPQFIPDLTGDAFSDDFTAIQMPQFSKSQEIKNVLSII